MSEKDIIEASQGLLIWFKNIWLCISWFLASCFYKWAKWIMTDKKKELNTLWFTLFISTIIWSVLKVFNIVDISKIQIAYFLIWMFSISIMEKVEKILLAKLDKIWKQ